MLQTLANAEFSWRHMMGALSFATAIRAKALYQSRLSSLWRKPPASPLRLPDLDYNDAPVISRLIFICGLHRSGTTLVERMLTSQFDTSYLRGDVPESEGQHLQSVYSPASEFGGAGRFAFSREMHSELDRLLRNRAECRARIMANWNQFVVGTNQTLVEKSPPNLTKISWLRQVFPQSQFVIVTRDPRAATAATQKWSGTSLAELMRHWDQAHSKAIAEFRADDCTTVRYEDVCKAPEEQIARLAKFLGVSPRDRKNGLEHRHQRLSNSNARYVQMHGNSQYGPGAWNAFGYEV